MKLVAAPLTWIKIIRKLRSEAPIWQLILSLKKCKQDMATLAAMATIDLSFPTIGAFCLTCLGPAHHGINADRHRMPIPS